MSRAVQADSQAVDALFAPTLRRKSAPTPAAPLAAPNNGRISASEVSRRYKESNRLEYGDRILDGFCDHIGDGVVVDRGSDDQLNLVISKSQSKLQKASDPVTALMVLALLVSDVCGRTGSHAIGLQDRCAKTLQEQRGPDGKILLGQLFGEQAGKKKVPGACLSQHRALAFKVFVDSLGAPECTLERNAERMTAWNTVHMNKVDYVVDLLHDPGSLYEAESAKQHEYLRLLELEFTRQTTTISRRTELAGKVPRPAWHVEVGELTYSRDSEDRIGRGGFGEVFRGSWADTTVAIKVVRAKEPTDQDVCDFILEIALLSRLR